MNFSITLVLSLSLSIFLIGAQGSVPAKDQYRMVNKGGYPPYNGDIEYSPDARIFQTSNDIFHFGFYNTTPNSYTLALGIGNKVKESVLRWVWEANRDSPVRENAVLTFGEDGNLVLAEADGRMVWQTNTANRGAVGIKILENGNMVIYDAAGRFLWQSFDSPTDTLLVGQSLYGNKLVSRQSRSVNTDGPYSLAVSANKLALYYTTNKLRSPVVYYAYEFPYEYLVSTTLQVLKSPDTTWTLQIEGVEYNSERKSSVLLSRPNFNSTLSFLRLGLDGNVKIWSYSKTVPTSTPWDVAYTAFSNEDTDGNDECRIPEHCGDFGLCKKGQCNACPTDKGLIGWDETCKSPSYTTCQGEPFHYFKIEGADSFMTKYNRGQWKAMREEFCEDDCTYDCKCLGFFYNRKEHWCWLSYDLKTMTRTGNSSLVAYVKAPNTNTNSAL